MEHLRYPNESAEYRVARNALLEEEIALRKQIEAVAAKRRSLPPGGKVPEDYVFERIGSNSMPEKVKMSELFGRHDTLILYSFMYGPERELPCPGHPLARRNRWSSSSCGRARGASCRRQIADRTPRGVGPRTATGTSFLSLN